MVALTLSNEKSELLPILKKLGVFLNKKDFALDIKPLLRLVLSRYFGDVSCLVDAITQHFKNATAGTQTKVLNYYRNSNDNHETIQELIKCDSKGPLLIHTTKMYYNESTFGFNVLGRIISGTVHKG